MADLLVDASRGVMLPLLSKLSKLLEEEYVKLKGLRKQILFLKDELSAMSPALQMLTDTEKLNPQMEEWRNKVRELAYDIEDCVDAFMSRVNHDRHSSSFKEFYHKLKNLKARHEIADEIEKLKKRAIEASERYKRYNFVMLASKSGSSFVDPRLPAIYEEIDRLVGIDGPKKHIIERLSLSTRGSISRLKVLSIVGCGGLGKTTIANQVYHTIKSQFSCAAFVSVSRSPNMRKILSDIAKGVHVTDNPLDDDEQQVINKLREHLHDKRYFVVIDDIWDKRAWQIIELALLDNDCGSRIITTTRSVTVASFCSAHGGSVYHMEPLSSNDSKRLFFRRAFGSENSYYPHLGYVPHEILGKCGGLPLAIITISSMLADQHAKAEWERVLNAIGSGLARDPDAERMTNILALSYFDLPHNLKTCLLYLSIFPEDQTIERQCLINKWIAEGFVCDEKGRSAYETGERCFNDLINRSMIQPVGVIYGQAKACRVHDIILDYIKCKAAEDNFLTSLDATDHGFPSEYKVRRLCVVNNDEEKATRLTSPVLSHVRSLTIFGNPVQISFSAFTALRVLDLANCSALENHHLSSIKKLFNLKYLRLGSHSITYLPDKIGEMQYLETLDVQDTQIKELPSSITKLKRLAHLYVDSGTRFPDGMIGQMQSMEELCKYGLVSYEQGKTLQEFNKLTKLRTLDISWNFEWPHNSEEINKAENFHSHVGNLLSSCNLHNLHIVDTSDEHYPLSLDSWRPASPCSLRKLHLKECPIYKVPDWIPRLGNLGVLELYIICMRPDDVEILGAIRSLLFLELGTTGATNGSIIFNDINGFRNLKYFSLAIDACGTALKFEAGSMPMLEHLKLQLPVHKMKCLNGTSNFGIQHLSELSKLEVEIRCICDDEISAVGENNGISEDVKCVSSSINTAVQTLPNHPTVRIEARSDNGCAHFKFRLKRYNMEYGILNEWLKIWHIEEGQEEQLTAETEQEIQERIDMEMHIQGSHQRNYFNRQWWSASLMLIPLGAIAMFMSYGKYRIFVTLVMGLLMYYR